MSKDSINTSEANTHPVDQAELLSWYERWSVQAIIICMIAIALYANTFRHEYALDDTVVILRNEYVHKGFAGLPDILSKDAYCSYYEQLKTTNQLSGGRYRPLSIVTFAVEQQFFGAVARPEEDSVLRFDISNERSAPYEVKFIEQMHVRHIVNVLLYALLGVVLLCFLRLIVFRSSPVTAFVAALLFVIHPIHTEVVANVKSRDEIMSLIFICLTFIFAYKYRAATDKKGFLVLGLFSYFLAFLSKEYAITLAVLLPLMFYLFNGNTPGKSLVSALPYYAVIIVYLAIRVQVLGPRNELSDDDIQINPYAWASGAEKMATEIATSLNYLKLLIFPHPLSSDYSYNQIPYKDFGNPIVWISVIVHLGLTAALVYYIRKRHVLGFAIAFFLLNLLMVNNFLFDIGATMGERLIFHASVGFVIALAYGMRQGIENIRSSQTQRLVAIPGLVLLIILCGYKTIDRNKDWKSDATLFMQDINTVPNSFLVNANVACMLINQSDFQPNEQASIAYLKRGVQLYTKVIGMQENYVLGYFNRSIGYLKLGYPDSMATDLDKILTLYPIHPRLPEMYYRAGMLFYEKGQYMSAKNALTVSAKLYPNDPSLQKALYQVDSILQNGH